MCLRFLPLIITTTNLTLGEVEYFKNASPACGLSGTVKFDMTENVKKTLGFDCFLFF